MAVTVFGHCAISGEIGSGKTSVAKLLGHASGREVVHAGSILREAAAALGVTVLEANSIAEQDEDLDLAIDEILLKFGRSNSSLIFDSRMAWYILPSAFKVHLIVNPDVAAQRLVIGRASEVERYRSLEEARRCAEQRYQSERRRFDRRYGVDMALLSNYDLVVDTSDAEPNSVAVEIQAAWAARQPEYPLRGGPRVVQPF